MTRIPQLSSIEFAIKLYYEKIEIGNKDISELFNINSSSTICRIKKMAKAKMIAESTPIWNSVFVNTRVAYTAWGLDIKDLELRYNKLKKFNHSCNDTQGTILPKNAATANYTTSIDCSV